MIGSSQNIEARCQLMVSRSEYITSQEDMERSPFDPKPIKTLFGSAITDRINDREILMKGIDYSYYCETIDE